MTAVKYRIGVDVGDRSVGLSAFEFDDDGFPLRKLAMVSYRHDGGMDPSTGKSPRSRKATAGEARRVRRMHRRRRKRLSELDTTLRSLGYPVPEAEVPQTYEAWHARARLVSEPISDRAELNELLVLAIRHIARHRGWRNPWWSFRQLEEAARQFPSVTMQKIQENAEQLLRDRIISPDVTIGELGAMSDDKDTLLRPRTFDATKKPKKLNNQGVMPVLQEKVRQEDLLHEVWKFWETQSLLPTEHRDTICRALFEQTRPSVPVENVGKDPLPGQGGFIRASRVALEFQEYRIRDVVSNLRIGRGNSKRPLTAEEYDAAVSYLWNFTEDAAPTWGDVAEELNIAPSSLVAPVVDGNLHRSAPYNRSASVLANAKKLKKTSQVRSWWEDATYPERSLFLQLITDATEDAENRAEEAGILDIYMGLPEDEKEILEGLSFESGRVAYSVDSLEQLNAYMQENRCDVYTARSAVFGTLPDWQPPRESLDAQTGQPAVDRVLTIVRRFILACERKWGRPERVVIEYARLGLMGPTQRAEVLREQETNRRNNDRVRSELVAEGITNPTRADVRRHRIVQNQNGCCLYCGTTITTEYSELDHVVPRSGGGSSRVDNLVAVCRQCNKDKGATPFAVWASACQRPGVSVEEAVERLRSFNKVKEMRGVSGTRLKRQIARRLQQTQEDEPIDERSLASTSYAAVEVRQRIETYFNVNLPNPLKHGDDGYVYVDVYSGSLTRESRRAGGIDQMILLRGEQDKNRFDVRHHAIDAAVMTLLNPSVAVTLKQRQLLHTERTLGSRDNNWREFTGLTLESQQKFLKWRQTCEVLAGLISEAIVDDTIPVINPLRLTPSNGAVHKDTLAKLQVKKLGEQWTEGEILLITDPDVYVAVNALPRVKKVLAVDSQRQIELPNGKVLGADSDIRMFTEKAASIVAGNGGVKIGDSLHHGRLYAYVDRKGHTNVGIQRVFGAEFPWLMRISGVKDIFKVPIHRGSQSYRDLQDGLRKQIEAGNAREIGWFMVKDELEISADFIASQNATCRRFIELFPETKWVVRGIPEARRVKISPLYLSYEQMPSGLVEEDLKIIQDVVEKGIRPTLSKLFEEGQVTILRRDALGNPRWKGNGRLPLSFTVLKRAEEILGEE